MKVREAKQLAREWVAQRAGSIPNYAGTIMTGSIHWSDDEADWPASSDVDLNLLQETDTPLVHRKVPYAGIIIEASYQSAGGFRDVPSLLANAYAPHWMHPCVVDDPQGWLTDVHRQVTADYAKPQWVRKRIENVAGNAAHKLTNARDRQSTFSRMLQFTLGIRNIAAIPAVAAKVNPTNRRCLVLAGKLMRDTPLADLHEEMLRAMGGPGLSAATVTRHIAQVAELLDVAVGVLKTPFWGDFNVEPCIRPIAVGGSLELVRAGLHREAEFLVLLMLYFCHRALANDGPEADKPGYQQMLNAVLDDVGLGGPDGFAPRAIEALALLEKVKLAVLAQCE